MNEPGAPTLQGNHSIEHALNTSTQRSGEPCCCSYCCNVPSSYYDERSFRGGAIFQVPNSYSRSGILHRSGEYDDDERAKVEYPLLVEYFGTVYHMYSSSWASSVATSECESETQGMAAILLDEESVPKVLVPSLDLERKVNERHPSLGR